jgi:MFS family permease
MHPGSSPSIRCRLARYPTEPPRGRTTELDAVVTYRRRIYEGTFGPIPIRRLSSTHALSTAADAFFTVSLAGSLFFNVSVGAARPRVIAYLIATLAPFVVLAPLVGPLIDRFGRARRAVAASTCLGRGILCSFVAGDLRNLLLYPEAFGILVLEKAYSVTKSSLVPSLVDHNADLVATNSRLSRISTIAGLIGGLVAVAVAGVSSVNAVLRIGALTYFAAAIVAMSIPPDDPARLPPAALESEELHSPTIRAAASAMTVLRGAIGFLVFLVAFELKRSAEPTWLFGVLAGVSIAGGLAGTVLSPVLRRRIGRDEPVVTVALVTAASVSLGAAAHVVRASIAVAVFAIACAASMGRQAFDSILQRDAPRAARGRSFARFETLFQLVWVLGALGGVALQPSARTGLSLLGAIFVLTLLAYGIAGKGATGRHTPPAGRDGEG